MTDLTGQAPQRKTVDARWLVLPSSTAKQTGPATSLNSGHPRIS